MTDDKQVLAMHGARFFGEMAATLSHEIKNVMAIINENAGLLKDMVAMHRQGVPFPAERIEKLAQSVARQIARADDIIQTMNRFAHSADHGREAVDIAATVQLVAKLADRLIMMQGARFDIRTPAKTVTAATNRFFLEYVIWRCMVAAMAGSRSATPVRILAETTAEGPCLRFCDMQQGDEFPASALAPLEEGGVLALVGARLMIFPARGEFRVLLTEESV